MSRHNGTMRLFDTARGAVVPFEPGEHVTMYVCGITPYDSTHLGHAFTYLTHDLVVRRLEDLGHTVTMVRNVTDVDDSILPKARELGIHYLELAEREMARFHRDLELLDLRPAASEPRATESIDAMIEVISRLLERGHAYTVDGITYYDVSTFDGFGKLSGYPEATMIDFARERGGTPDDPRQRNPLDFILWQPSADDEPSWPSPFGDGRPGWHIECSAMSMAAHGPTIDLHGGGNDLIFPHHECETAQSEAANGAPFVRHWLHVGMVAYEGTKMSKSLGNLVFVSDLVKVADPRAIRLALLGHHYRSGFEWFDGDIDEAATTLDRWLLAAGRPSGPDGDVVLAEVRAALDDDLDTEAVVAALDRAATALLDGDGNDPDAGRAFHEAASLVGIPLDRPAQTH